MASALPQAIGAQLSHPGRQVITLSGDGGLAMFMGDLLSLRQLALPVKLVVFKNGAFSFVELEMRAAGILDYAMDLRHADFAKMAEAAGLLGLTAETPEQVRPMLVQALDRDGPALVDVVVNRQELAMPPSMAVYLVTTENSSGNPQVKYPSFTLVRRGRPHGIQPVVFPPPAGRSRVALPPHPRRIA